MTADFILFDGKIINKRDVMKIYKVVKTDKRVSRGIQLIIRHSGYVTEWYGDDQSKRNERFDVLTKVLCH